MKNSKIRRIFPISEVVRMGRPRRDYEGPSAEERVIEAFWTMLEEMPYDEIKVLALACRANVTPSTLYYHYDGVADVAAHALDATFLPDFAVALAAGDERELGRVGDAESKSLRRIALFAGSGSGLLSGMLSGKLLAQWLEWAGMAAEDLEDDQRRDLRFIAAGVVAMYGDESLPRDPSAVADFVCRPLGSGVVETMRHLSSKAEMAQ